MLSNREPASYKDLEARHDAEEKLMQLNLKFGLAHAAFLFLFLFLQVFEMAAYNVFSVLFFLFLYSGLRRHRFLHLDHVSFVVSAEFILHQVLATVYTIVLFPNFGK